MQMVKVRYLNKKGDSVQKLALCEARELLGKEIENGNLVYDEDERRIVEKATLGKINGDSNIAVLPRIAGG